MKFIKYVLNMKKNTKKIEEMENEIIEQDDQYEELLQQFTKMEGQVDLLIERNKQLEEEHSKQIETIGKLRKKITELKKELKDIKNI